MANVHGLNNFNNQGGRRIREPMIGPGNPDDALVQAQLANGKVPFFSGMNSDRSPLDETVPYTLQLVWCPNFKFLSITTFLLLIIWSVYIFCCTQGIDQKRGVLGINVQVLQKYGGLSKTLVENGEVWRMFTAAFLHLDLLHITMNSLSISFFLTRVQQIYNPLLLLVMLFLSAIGGSIFSLLMMDYNTISVGSSTMIFGVFGCLLGYMTLNWTYLGFIRSQLCCIIGFILFFSILFSFTSGVDAAAHFGGMIAGYFATLAFFPSFGQKNKIMTLGGCGALAIYFLTTFLVFYLTG